MKRYMAIILPVTGATIFSVTMATWANMPGLLGGALLRHHRLPRWLGQATLDEAKTQLVNTQSEVEQARAALEHAAGRNLPPPA